MATKYNIFTNESHEAVATRARKDAAVKYGDDLGVSYRVVTDSGKVVHEVTVTPEQQREAEAEADVRVEPAPVEEATATEPEPPVEPKFDLKQMKSKIAKLLAKAEGSSTEEERAAFTAKAEELMLKLGINAAELEATGEVKPEEIVEVQRPYSGGYAREMVDLVHAVCSGWGNLTTLQSGRGANRMAWIIGHKTDVELVQQLISSIELQAMAALHHWQRTEPSRKGQDNNARTIGSRSFIAGYAQVVRQRLFELRMQVEEEATPGAALVLASKQDRINSWMENQYPDLKEGRADRRRYSSVGARAGAKAGLSADLGQNTVDAGDDELKELI